MVLLPLLIRQSAVELVVVTPHVSRRFERFGLLDARIHRQVTSILPLAQSFALLEIGIPPAIGTSFLGAQKCLVPVHAPTFGLLRPVLGAHQAIRH